MEINPEEGTIKYSKLIEQNAEDKEPSLILSQKTIDKLKPEKLVLEGIENNNYPSNAKVEQFGVDLSLKLKGKERKFGFKTLVGLCLAILMIVIGLIAGLFVMKLQNEDLELKLDSKHQVTEDLLHAKNMSQAQIDDLILQNKDQLNKYEVAVNHLKNAIDDKGLLFDAIKSKDVEKVKLFLGLGADVNARRPDPYNSYEATPLHYAARYCQIDIVKILLQQGADVNAVNSGGETPLHEATKKNATKIVDLLLQNGANVNAKDRYRFTPLYLAVRESNIIVAELLLKNGAKINATWNTPLHKAVLDNDADIAELLIQYGANINAFSLFNNTPLHLAATYHQLKIVQILLNNGARKDLKNRDGKTPEEVAIEMKSKNRDVAFDKKFDQIIELLKNN